MSCFGGGLNITFGGGKKVGDVTTGRTGNAELSGTKFNASCLGSNLASASEPGRNCPGLSQKPQRKSYPHVPPNGSAVGIDCVCPTGNIIQ